MHVSASLHAEPCLPYPNAFPEITIGVLPPRITFAPRDIRVLQARGITRKSCSRTPSSRGPNLVEWTLTADEPQNQQITIARAGFVQSNPHPASNSLAMKGTTEVVAVPQQGLRASRVTIQRRAPLNGLHGDRTGRGSETGFQFKGVCAEGLLVIATLATPGVV